MENKKTFIKYFVIVLVIIGGLGVLGKLQDRVTNQEATDDGKNRNDFFEVTNFMGGSKKEYNYTELKGGIINCVMGGTEIYLTPTNIKKGATIDVFLMMGGAKIIVPKDWNIVLDTANIMGDSKDNSTEDESVKNDSKTLKINGTVIMGGLEVIRY
ncbi:MAG: cell wall-active antibiotics response protein [Leadbetterella sp.]|nr:cell wall-active antibiotics response protein [Leadbetterella sp.]